MTQITSVDHQPFVRASMRHLAALDHVRPGPASDAPPYPDDWFDLPQDALADLGAMTYLLSLSSYHATMPLSEATAHLEVALRLGQYRIFRSGGFPRGFVTWAGLADGAERRFALHHKPLMPRHWNSGPSKWMIDFVAPFGHTREILRVLASNPNESRVRTLWHNAKGTRYRIIEWARPAPGAPIGVRSFGVGQFARHLEAV